jgi:hypothetical protein
MKNQVFMLQNIFGGEEMKINNKMFQIKIKKLRIVIIMITEITFMTKHIYLENRKHC